MKFDAALSKIFSVSELETYGHCPHEYYLKYVLGLPANGILKTEAQGIPANVRGSIVHAIIQKYDPARDNIISDLIAAECLAASIYPDKKTLREIEGPLEVFAKSDVAKQIGEGNRELRFDWQFEGSIITGSIDWLKPLDGGFAIFDFKTDEIEPSAVEKRSAEYDLQLTTYALAVMAATGKPVKETSLYFLGPDILHTTPMDDKRAAGGMQKLKTIIAGIKGEKFDIGDKPATCYKCPYSYNKMCRK